MAGLAFGALLTSRFYELYGIRNGLGPIDLETYPEGPSTHCLRALDPKAMNGMVFGTRVFK